MKVIFKISLMLIISIYSLNAVEIEEKRERIHSVRKVIDTIAKSEDKEVSVVDRFKHIFSDGKVSGELRAIYGSYDLKKADEDDTYATAIGGILKYELASFNGFNAGVAMYTSHDIAPLTGNGVKQNSELSSSKGSYTELAEAYINYTDEDFNLRVGRQVLYTPLADSDDRRMIQNTFNASVLSYNYIGFEFMLGNIQSWQGVDADLDDSWVKVGDKGANFGGISYNDKLELNAWYYNITQETNAMYLDFGGSYDINNEMEVHIMLQYLHEEELNKSGIGADIYGGLAEFVLKDVGFNFSYNSSVKKPALKSFSGTGGGTLYTSMDTTILDDIAEDRSATSYVVGISYTPDDFSFLYAYGDFSGDENSLGKKEHIVEQDIGVEYNINDKFLISAIFVMVEDKENIAKTDFDWNRVQTMVNYNF